MNEQIDDLRARGPHSLLFLATFLFGASLEAIRDNWFICFPSFFSSWLLESLSTFLFQFLAFLLATPSLMAGPHSVTAEAWRVLSEPPSPLTPAPGTLVLHLILQGLCLFCPYSPIGSEGTAPSPTHGYVISFHHTPHSCRTRTLGALIFLLMRKWKSRVVRELA